eukprot:4485585-Alexandrium_andersonii.AAC.1
MGLGRESSSWSSPSPTRTCAKARNCCCRRNLGSGPIPEQERSRTQALRPGPCLLRQPLRS